MNQNKILKRGPWSLSNVHLRDLPYMSLFSHLWVTSRGIVFRRILTGLRLSARAVDSDLQCPGWAVVNDEMISDSEHLPSMYSNTANRFLGPSEGQNIKGAIEGRSIQTGREKKEIIQAHQVIQKL